MDSRDFADAVEAHGPRLYRLAGRIAPPGVEADDLLQETFERAWRNREQFRGHASVATWLQAIMVNRARDRTRAWMRVQGKVGERVDSDAGLSDSNVEDPAELVTRIESEETLRAGLARLPLPERAAVALHDGEGFPASEVAQMLDCSEASAHKRIQRGRFRLAEVLGFPGPRSRPPLSCRSTKRSASAYLDGDLSPEAAGQVEQHLRECECCPPVLQALVGIRDTLNAKPTRPLPEATLDRLRKSIKVEGDGPS
jgi:RNA polymerase sigma-70 factor, ECF subfamily